MVRQATESGVTARLSMSPEPAVAMKPLLLSVALSGADGRPLTAPGVTFDLSMPSMTMAPNRPAVDRAGAGVYEATTLLSMGGQWRLIVELPQAGHVLTIPFAFSAH